MVIIKNPSDNNRNLIKRLIAFSGEFVEIKNGTLFINGNYFTDDLISKIDFRDIPDFNFIVPERQYFVVGDNLKVSLDSRHFGSIPGELIIGPVIKRYWPPGRYKEYQR